MVTKVNNNTDKSGIPFFPNHAMTEVAVALFVVGGVLFLSAMVPKELHEAANPLVTPEHILPEWYFLWMFALLKYLPKLLGIVIPALVFVAIMLIPWFDRSDEVRPSKRPIIVSVVTVSLIIIAILSYLGAQPMH